MKNWNEILKEGKFYWVIFEKKKAGQEIVKYENGIFHSTDGSKFTPKACDHVDERPIGIRGYHANWL